MIIMRIGWLDVRNKQIDTEALPTFVQTYINEMIINASFPTYFTAFHTHTHCILHTVEYCMRLFNDNLLYIWCPGRTLVMVSVVIDVSQAQETIVEKANS